MREREFLQIEFGRLFQILDSFFDRLSLTDRADFGALRKPAFSGQCPTAYDGQELVFEFTTATGTERVASCESALDYRAPLFRALAAALGTASPFKAAT